MTEEEHHDVVIIGAGAAGLSAGLVLARAGADALLIDAGEPRNAPATHMQGFLSRDGVPPQEFLAMGRREVAGYGASILAAHVAGVETRDDDSFAVRLTDGTVRAASAILVATGLTDELPLLAGLRSRWGTLVHHCPYCHGHEVRDQAIAVIGGPVRDLSIRQAGLLRRLSARVAFITNGIELTSMERHRLEAFGVRVVDGAVSHLVGGPGSLEGAALVGGDTVNCTAAFIAPRQRPNDGLLRSLGCAIDTTTGLVAVDAAGQTSVPGVWAAGNVVTPTAQVITAAGAASASAIAINGWLLHRDLDAASAGRP